jgi:Tfp pilus assembly protein PilX
MFGSAMSKPRAPQPRRWSRLRRQDGFTLILALLVLLITSLLLVAAFTAANGEIHLTSTDTAQKKAYYAAEAGLEDYEYQLTQDGNYLTYCTTPPAANPALNQYYKEGVELEGLEKFVPLKTSELSKAEVPGTSGEETYALRLIPAKTDTEPEDSAEPSWKKVPHCDRNRVVASMIEEKEGAASGTFQIESTGFSGKQQRTLVATFRNANFVSYVWYSVYETGDPSLYGEPPLGKETYYSECAKFYQEREKYAPQCKPFNNYFISGETVNGPMHTEDHLGICGNPTFGRNKNDRIEFGNGSEKEASKGYTNAGCPGGEAANPKFEGTEVSPKEDLQITPPPGDEELIHVVETSPTNYLFEGQTEIVLKGSTMTIIEHKGSHPTPAEEAPPREVKKEETKTGVEFPANGVIYVVGEKGGTCEAYSPFGPAPEYTKGSACGNVYVQGEYSKALTIAAQNDVIINENVYPSSVAGKLGAEPTGNAMLGLIANNFVRVYHPLTGTREKNYTKCGTSENDMTSTATIPKDNEEPYIYAAILALKHSFIVDNFDCGKPLKKLNVYGAVAGEFTNGMTGVFGSGNKLQSGYGYNLKYDNRLQAAEPPHFLNPIQAAWYIQRQTLASAP